MIDIDKKYQTRDGRKVRLISNNGTEQYPIIGAIEGQPSVSCWNVHGLYTYPRGASDATHSFDLVPVPEAPPAPTPRASTYENTGPFEAHGCVWLRVNSKKGRPLKVPMPTSLAVRLRDLINEVN